MLRALFTLLVIGVVAGGGGWYYYENEMVKSVPKWSYVKAEKGNIDLTIRSTGTIEPEEVVDVGAQIVGLVMKFGEDPAQPNHEVYWNSKVEEGTILAYIDPRLYQAQVDVANANLQKAHADVASAQAVLKQATADFGRAKTLFDKKAYTQADLDQAEATLGTATANVDVAKSEVAQDEAALKTAQINLDYTVIKSPVKGTIIDRRVNIGQTVVSSLSAPSLFLIAKDLTRLQIWASVNEADIGHITPGQSVTFTVDASGDRVFKGTVLQIRLNATMNQNVITYTVVVNIDNSDLALKPYGTATMKFDAGRHDNVLLVPNMALQWHPLAAQMAYVAPEARKSLNKSHKPQGGGSHASSGASPGGSAPSGPMPGGHTAPAGAATPGGIALPAAAKPEKDQLDKGTVWVFDGQYLQPVKVRIGVTDMVNTEIVSGDLKEGAQIVVGEDHETDDSGATGNLFAPKIFGGKK